MDNYKNRYCIPHYVSELSPEAEEFQNDIDDLTIKAENYEYILEYSGHVDKCDFYKNYPKRKMSEDYDELCTNLDEILDYCEDWVGWARNQILEIGFDKDLLDKIDTYGDVFATNELEELITNEMERINSKDKKVCLH